MNATIKIKGFDHAEQIALGRRAAVFRARERDRARTVVFKVLLPHLVEDPRFLKRFKRDVQIATRVEHPNLVNVLLYGRADESYFVAYEHYRGVALEEVLQGQARIPVDVALQIIVEAAEGLTACHSAQLIHRDVRPANLVLTNNGSVKLDGLALATDLSDAGRLVFAGRVFATAGYMSPEQTLGMNLGAQTDVFSLGVVAWELLSGKPAFGHGSPAEVAERIQTTPLKRISEINPMVEPAVGDIVDGMLAKDRTRRYASAAEVASDLREAMESTGRVVESEVMARFVENPQEFSSRNLRSTAAFLKERINSSSNASPATLIQYYEKLAYLEPDVEEHRREIARLRAVEHHAHRTGASPQLDNIGSKATYRIILESIDTSRESKATFALKLANKLRVPLKTVKTYIENMPAALPGQHVHRKAVFVAGILEELGGVARVEVCRPQQRHRACPECGAQVEPDAAYCEFCQHRFVAVVELRAGLGDSDFDSERQGDLAGKGLVGRLMGLSSKAKLLVGLGLALLVILVVSSM